MHYDGRIRVQNSINIKCLKTMSKTVNCLKRQSGYEVLSKTVRNATKPMIPLYTHSYMESFSSAVTLFQNSIIKNCIQNSMDIYKNLKCTLSNYDTILQQCILNVSLSFKQWKDLSDRCLFLKIADEIEFPIYLESDSELQDRLLYSYKQNGNQCNEKEMFEIILEYYDDDYIGRILNGIKNVHVFSAQRVVLLEEGIEAYQLGLYGPSASLFVDQLSGMIRDVYKKLSTFYRISNKEKNELLISYNQNCKPDSEKGMLLQIVDSQSQGFIIWYKVLQYFLNIVYSSKGHDMNTQPQRHMICHGKQTNYNTKEMNLKLILCMDIIAELAWGVKRMKEECSEIVIDV